MHRNQTLGRGKLSWDCLTKYGPNHEFLRGPECPDWARTLPCRRLRTVPRSAALPNPETAARTASLLSERPEAEQRSTRQERTGQAQWMQ